MSVDRPLRTRPLILGTRGSALALRQTEWAVRRLQAAWPALACETRLISTSGDRRPDLPLPEVGGKGWFTLELEEALRMGEIDLAVHSLKDLPVGDSPGLTLGAVCERVDPRDALVSREGMGLATLPVGARVGSSSLRRKAQLLAARPDLQVAPVRGNVDTRIRKLEEGQFEAIVLAAAGLIRLGLEETVAEYLPLEVMLPAPGQGALALQCRAEDDRVAALLDAIDHVTTRRATSAERAFLQALGGGCAMPVAAYASPIAGSGTSSTNPRDGPGRLQLTGLVASLDGKRQVRVCGEAPSDEAEVLGASLGRRALTEGAGELLR